MNRPLSVVLALGVVVASGVAAFQALGQDKKQSREEKVRSDKARHGDDALWIYDDLPRGIEEAKKSGRPLLVVFRCIPCEACAKLDEDVVTGDPIVKGLLEKFVCVRVPHANGMDLSLFQFDYDQSWAAFMLNSDMTIYGRYGTRSNETRSEDDVSLEGFAAALQGALDLHAAYPGDKASLAGKRGPASEVKVPEDLPSLPRKFASDLDWKGDVVQSCLHCHQVGQAIRIVYRTAGKPIPDALLHPYPHPKSLGLVIDPKSRARVANVASGSPAQMDGFRPGDDIAKIEGQPILSIADIQWVLNGAGETASLRCDVMRDGKPTPLTLTLGPGWRSLDDISWRVSSWDLRRMVTGGMRLEDVPDAERKTLGLDAKAMALRVRTLGGGPRGAANAAGLAKGDVLVALAGRSDRMTESALLASLATSTKPGEKIAVTALRDGKKLEFQLPTQ